MGKDFSKELLEIALNIIVTSRIAFGGWFFRILPLIRSIPRALLFFYYDSDFLCRCFRYGVLIIRRGISGSCFIVSKSIEIAAVAIMWCKCTA